MKYHVGITIDSKLFREIEKIRGREKRSTFYEYLLRLGLKNYKIQEQAKQQQPEEPIIGPDGKPW